MFRFWKQSLDQGGTGPELASNEPILRKQWGAECWDSLVAVQESWQVQPTDLIRLVQYWWYLAGLFPCRTTYVSASVFNFQDFQVSKFSIFEDFFHFSVYASLPFPVCSISLSYFDASWGINLACWNICIWFNIWTECLASKKHRCTYVQTASKYLNCFLHFKATFKLREMTQVI